MTAPSPKDLEAPFEKLKRAEHHINDLNRQIEAFLAEKPFKLWIRSKRKSGWIELFIKDEPSLPPDFPLIIGDAVHNMRAALDLTLFPMARESSPSPHYIEFPFPKKAEGLEGAINGGQVKFAGEKVAEAVRSLKPYPGGNAELCGIHTLDVRDKHHLLILSHRVPQFTGGVNAGLIKRFLKLDLPDGTHIRFAAKGDNNLLRIETTFVTRDMPDTEHEADIQPTFVISFGEGQPFEFQPVIETLVKLKKEAERAVNCMLHAFRAQN